MRPFAILLLALAAIPAQAISAGEAGRPRPTLLYVMDPLCGWCYAFAEQLGQVRAVLGDSIAVQVVLGGMVTGESEGPMGDRAGFILQAIPRLEEHTGVVIGEAYKEQLRIGTRWSSSVRPSMAVAAFRALLPDSTPAFAHGVQRALFQDGADLNDRSMYAPIAERFGLEADRFENAFTDPAAKLAFEADMHRSAELGVQGFPALFLLVGDRTEPICAGYMGAAAVVERIRPLLKGR